ncbi:hypothetical protein BJY52DRAFT_1290809 [Lactarius psammicola]|nr:hypothetical protein BJY52DRAFT_1290809 [Lactarius psammicola]
MTKTHTTLDTAARDGPLLNFCKLGHLGMMAVPFKGSGLADTDFKKLLDLLQKMMEDPRRPLTLASTPVWEDLGQLRVEVLGVFAWSSSDSVDKVNMKALLAKIDEVYRHRPSSTKEHRPSDHVHAKDSEAPAFSRPNPPSRWPMPAYDRSSYASTSTTVIEDRHDSSPAQEADFKGIAPTPFNNSRSEFPNLYSIPYPLLPSQIGPGGAIARPFFASFLPTLLPPLGNTDLASPGIPSIHHPYPYLRHNDQLHRAPVYYPPRGDAPASWACQSATLPSLRSSTIMLSTSSNTWFGSSSTNGVYSSTPPASLAHEKKKN